MLAIIYGLFTAVFIITIGKKFSIEKWLYTVGLVALPSIFCIVVDIIIEMYLFLLYRKLPNANIKLA
jgi:hypothetical protein